MLTNPISDPLALTDRPSQLGVEQSDLGHGSFQAEDVDPVLAYLRSLNCTSAVLQGLAVSQRAISDVLLRER